MASSKKKLVGMSFLVVIVLVFCKAETVSSNGYLSYQSHFELGRLTSLPQVNTATIENAENQESSELNSTTLEKEEIEESHELNYTKTLDEENQESHEIDYLKIGDDKDDQSSREDR